MYSLAEPLFTVFSLLQTPFHSAFPFADPLFTMYSLLQTPLQPPDLLNIRVPPAVPPRARETSLNRSSQVGFFTLFSPIFFENRICGIMIAICVIE